MKGEATIKSKVLYIILAIIIFFNLIRYLYALIGGDITAYNIVMVILNLVGISFAAAYFLRRRPDQ
ncbi:hypothetical protein ACFPU1_12650 [Thalassorhabdus alkalitolerans]|uniref:PEP-CTERM protein-sorting domain-containing protein n=1 Tax=Thalassorhabdus alkalitolerans TaxID=2282697 RepID=A0ABW0YMF8_9BACI